ncbi:MAG: TraR/DksA C4-type zinc finger protein [Planctomycetaceae bacterium]|nr:TraR/DksA C4-type zinc finger protein [Planctomycetaceae bacterium]
MLTKKDLEQFRALLIDLRARLRGDVKHLSDGALDDVGDSKSPTHMAELGTDAYERDFALSLMENDQETLNEITLALKRIDDGTFGLCEACLAEGKSPTKAAIPKTRLKAIPHARNCVECQGKLETVR